METLSKSRQSESQISFQNWFFSKEKSTIVNEETFAQNKDSIRTEAKNKMVFALILA